MIRTDRAQLKIIETGEGFLKAKVTFAVPGVFPYLYADGLKLEAKLPIDILSPKTIDSARGVPVTDGHPTDENGNHIFVTSDNYNVYAKGNISEPCVENGVGVALATIYDPVLIEEIKNKEKNSVSIGFSSDLELTPGTFNGVRYDSIQRNIVINHLACVDIARAGDATKIHVDRGMKMSDKKELAVDAGETTSDENKNKTYSYRKFDGSKDMAVSQEIHSELMFLRNQLKTDQDQIEALKQEIAQVKPSIPDPEGEAAKTALMEKLELLQQEVNAWKEKYSQLEESVPEMADAMAEEKAEVLKAAEGVDGINVDGLNTKEIKLQIISKALPFKEGIKTDSVSDEMINARYDAAIDLVRERENQPKQKNDISGKSIKIDKSEIDKKRENLKNLYRRDKK